MPLSGSATSGVREAAGPGPGQLEVVVVTAGDRRCGFRLADVDEVQRVVRITPLPGALDGFDGVVDRREELVAVLDGRRRLGVPSRAVRPSDRLLFLRVPGRIVALRVDSVLDVVQVAAPRPAPGPGGDPSCGLPGLGLVRLDDGLLVVDDVGRLLTARDARAVDAALAQLRPQAP